jgi:glutamine synthetase
VRYGNPARRDQDGQGKRRQVRRFPFYRYPWQGTARHRAGFRLRRRQVRKRPRFRRFLDRRLEGHSGFRHAADAGPGTAYIDPFFDETTLVITCDVVDPADGRGYDRDPRSIAKRAEAYLKSSGIGDTAYFGPEPEFFIFDSVEWNVDMSGCSLKIYSAEAAWTSGEKFEGGGNTGHRPTVKGGYFPVPPVDSLHDIRSAMVLALEASACPVEVHHHEVATAGQCEIGTVFNTLVKRADWTQILKYVVHNVAHQYGKTATFMPKPIVGDNGSGMHVHQSIWKDGKNLFAGQRLRRPVRVRAVLHRRHHQARQGAERHHQPGHQLLQASGAALRSAGQAGLLGQEPFGFDPHPARASTKARRIETRFPDPIANPYLCFAALMMAGLDGIQNKIHPGDPADKNLYDLPPEEMQRSRPSAPASKKPWLRWTRIASS